MWWEEEIFFSSLERAPETQILKNQPLWHSTTTYPNLNEIFQKLESEELYLKLQTTFKNEGCSTALMLLYFSCW